MKPKMFFLLAAALFCTSGAFADNVESLTNRRDQLKKQLADIQSEFARCEKQRKGWVAGTVIGGVGVVGTGIGIGVQAKQLKDLKSQQAEDNK